MHCVLMKSLCCCYTLLHISFNAAVSIFHWCGVFLNVLFRRSFACSVVIVLGFRHSRNRRSYSYSFQTFTCFEMEPPLNVALQSP
jgi:hypothetical protein